MHAYKSILATLFFAWTLFMTEASVAASRTEKVQPGRIRLHVVFNNVPYKAGLATSWGFSCLIEGVEKTVLFDTGGSGEILLSNMERVGLDAGAVDAVVLSHIHGDHTGGLGAVLARNPHVTVYMPESFPASFQQEVVQLGAAVKTVSGPQKLLNGMYSTGEMGGATKEQALIVDSPQGLIVITGCAHPNVANMAERARRYLNKNIYLLMGGFHLGGRSRTEIQEIIARLKGLGVKKVAPSHCTGDAAMRMFRDAWKHDFLEGGLGAVIDVALD